MYPEDPVADGLPPPAEDAEDDSSTGNYPEEDADVTVLTSGPSNTQTVAGIEIWTTSTTAPLKVFSTTAQVVGMASSTAQSSIPSKATSGAHEVGTVSTFQTDTSKVRAERGSTVSTSHSEASSTAAQGVGKVSTASLPAMSKMLTQATSTISAFTTPTAQSSVRFISTYTAAHGAETPPTATPRGASPAEVKGSIHSKLWRKLAFSKMHHTSNYSEREN